ncbi:MAG: GtrA family protein [Ruminococcaceae bacterium]|nr:GtrA family protein [Oscillospiraceae bacterium]
MKIKDFLSVSLIKEFFRYVIVGGISFLADFGTLTLFEEMIFRQQEDWQIFVSTAAGFIVGLIMNYILSLVFVFRASENRSSGKSVGEFVIFALVGVVGLGITEGLMHLGVNVLHFHYMFTKIVSAGIVLIWNYLGRKILVFSRPGGEKK